MWGRNKKETNPFLKIPADILLRYDHLAIHCSATPPSLDIGSEWIDNLHRNEFNWKNGNGYHVVLPLNGQVEMHSLGNACRPLRMAGAHVGDCGPGWNTRTLGICYIGGVDEKGVPQDTRTDAQAATLAKVIRWFYEAHPTPWKLTILGHRDLIKKTGAPSAKACPSFDVQTWLETAKPLAGFDWQSDTEDAGRIDRMPSPSTHTVRPGETFWKIAKTYGLDLQKVINLNYIRPEKLKPGDEIKLR